MYAGWSSSNAIPSLKCANSYDLYTITGASKGNKALTKPIGLISADEVAYAGGLVATVNKNYYLYNGQDYWTMSPSDSSNEWANVYIVYSEGDFDGGAVYGKFGVRPVINLRADVTLTGSGTSIDPYQVS